MARRSSRHWALGSGLWTLGLGLSALGFGLWVFAAPVTAQVPATERAKTEALARRVNERVLALQREAARLAGEARTLVGDLRRLEIERDLAVEAAAQAETDVASVVAELNAVTARLEDLERQREASLPDLRARMVDMYKRGRGSYARLLLGVRDLREFGRATRAVASLAWVNQQRVEAHRRTVEAMRKARAEAEERTRALQARQAAARRARAAAERALAARNGLIEEVDRRRDLTAQLAGELQVAQQKLDAALAAMGPGEAVEAVSVPMSPFRGALDWPLAGRVTLRFNQAGRTPDQGVRNGIEIAAAPDTPVGAVHPGTVGFADAFTGYGTLVILDHGANHYSLYGYLSSTSVERGDRVHAGDELGRVGSAPLGNPALYFELRIDGRAVDPVEWLKKP